MAVVSAIAVIAVITTEFTYNTGIDLQAAANARDEMRAHFLARSATNLSRLVIKIQKDGIDKHRKQLGDIQLADYLPMMIGAFGGGKEEVESLASLLGADPAAANGGEIKGLGLKEGEFDLEVTTDDGKINMNCAAGSEQTTKQLELTLTALVMPNVYDKIFEERDGDGQFTDRPTFVKALMDYVDKDTAAYGANGQPEDYGYQGYKARDNYLDSIEELRLVRGMDDKRWALFGPAFTIYGGCQVNVSAVSDITVIYPLLYAGAKDPEDPVLRDPQKLLALAAAVAQARTYGIMFQDLNDFAEFVKDPMAALALDQALAGQDGAAPPPNPALSGLPRVEGMELDVAKLGKIARAGGRRTYRVVASARIGKVEKKINAVWDGDIQNQNMRDPKQTRGAWVYWREE